MFFYDYKCFLIKVLWNTLTIHKVYRKQIMISEALNKIKQNSGTQFDPIIVETFERILPNIIRELREH